MNASVMCYRTTVLSPPALSGACIRGDIAEANRLIDNGHDVNEGSKMPPWTRRPSGETALMLASKLGRINSVELLLQRSANANQQQVHGATALHVACLNGKEACVALLLRYASSAEVNASARPVGPPELREWGAIRDELAGETPLTAAVSGRHARCVETLLEHTGCKHHEPRLLDQRTPLELALELRPDRPWSSACLEALIRGGCEIPEAMLLVDGPPALPNGFEYSSEGLALLLRAATEVWSPAGHRLYSTAARQQARFLVWLGGQISGRLHATDAGAFVDVWLSAVVPRLLATATATCKMRTAPLGVEHQEQDGRQPPPQPTSGGGVSSVLQALHIS